jgi:general secretion pathway protein I
MKIIMKISRQGQEENASMERGFTLLEVLVALSIMAIAVTLILQLFSADLRAVFVSGKEVSAAAKADARLREILTAAAISTEASWRETTNDGYRMDISIAEVLKDRTDSLPVKLLEIALTINWTEGAKEKSITLRTMKATDRMASGTAAAPA